jgi:hypothetical protein
MAEQGVRQLNTMMRWRFWKRGKQKGDIYRWWGWRIALSQERGITGVTRTMNTKTKKTLQSENRKRTWGKGVLEVLVWGCGVREVALQKSY